MDALKTALRTLLAADPVIAGLVGDRIRPDELDEEDHLPAIVLVVPEESSVDSLDDDSSTRNVTVSVSCMAHSAGAAGALAEAVIEFLDGYRGSASDVHLNPVTWQSTERDFSEADDASDDADVWLVAPHFTAWAQF